MANRLSAFLQLAVIAALTILAVYKAIEWMGVLSRLNWDALSHFYYP